MASPKDKVDRREFLKQSAWAAGVIVASAVALPTLINSKIIEPEASEVLRPPGAITEKDLLYACIKCGLCVQICPVRAVKLADVDDGLGYGAPYIDAREQACDFSCDAIQCAETCPTAALDFKVFRRASTSTSEQLEPLVQKGQLKPGEAWERAVLSMKEATRMGMAKINRKTCLAFQNKGFKGTPRGREFRGKVRNENLHMERAQPLREQVFDRKICDLCVILCPIGEKAISMVRKRSDDGKIDNVPVVHKGCVGCGTCEMVCPTEPSSIVVLPKKTFEEVYA